MHIHVCTLYVFHVYMCLGLYSFTGGGLVPTGPPVPPPYIPDIDYRKMQSEILSSIKSTLSEDVHRHVEEHVDKV